MPTRKSLTTHTVWGLLWQCNDWRYEHLHEVQTNMTPQLFATEKLAKEFAEAAYGHIIKRPNPHGWRVPKPVRVTIALCEPEPVKKRKTKQ